MIPQCIFTSVSPKLIGFYTEATSYRLPWKLLENKQMPEAYYVNMYCSEWLLIVLEGL